MQIVRWYRFSQLTTSIVKHIKPYQDSFGKLNEEIISLSTQSGQNERLADLQIKSSSLESYVVLAKEIDDLMKSIVDLDGLRRDKDLKEAVEEELLEKEEELAEVEEKVIQKILDKDPQDSSNVILEIKPGVGGSESSLFSKDVLEMYTGFADMKGWKWKIMQMSEDTQIGKGVKEAIVKIEGENVYSFLKYESGVHKVIRVPETEKAGRLHSSTACVIVMPDQPPDDFKVLDKDIKIEVMRARGPGGQHVNKTESAVRMTHIPTGITAQCQDTRSQINNRALALEVLLARVYDLENTKQMQIKQASKKKIKGSGDRSEKIRTYNYPQDRISDHRFELTVHGIAEMMKGLSLDKFIEAAQQDVRTRAINELLGTE